MEFGYALIGTTLLFGCGIASTVLVFLSKNSQNRESMFSKPSLAIFLMGIQIALVIGIRGGLSYAYGLNVFDEFLNELGFNIPAIIGIILLIIDEKHKRICATAIEALPDNGKGL